MFDAGVSRAVAEPEAPVCDAELEWRRKLVHMLPGLGPFGMWFVYHEDPLPAWNLLVAAAVVAILTLLAARQPKGVRRGSDENWRRRCLTYAVGPLLALILFPANAEYAGVVVCVLAFGDSSAALGGRWFGRRALPWNPDKTWMGLICFLFAAVPVGSLAYWGEAHPRVGVLAAVLCGACAAVPAGLAESLCSRVDDNLRISGAALVGVVLASKLALAAA